MSRVTTATMFLESVTNSFGLTRTLGPLTPLCDGQGVPISGCGAWAIVFKVVLEQRQEPLLPLKPYALRCFLEEPPSARLVCEFLNNLHSPYLVDVEYLEDELYVYDGMGGGGYCSVELMEWVGGNTLAYELLNLCRRLDSGTDMMEVQRRLSQIASEFDAFGLWLLEQEFSHGDITTYNLIVGESGGLKLIDYDGVYIPSLEEGRRGINRNFTQEFQHPLRRVDDYGLWVDDYSIALISLGLHLLVRNPQLLLKMRDKRVEIFDSAVFVGTDNSPKAESGRQELEQAIEEWFVEGNTALVRLADMVRGDSAHLSDLRGVLRQVGVGRQEEGPLELFRREGRYGYRMAGGPEVIPPIYCDAEEFSEGLATIRTPMGCAVIDNMGSMVVDCREYCSVESFRCGLARVKRSGLYGYIDSAGKEVIAPQYLRATSFRNNRARVLFEEEEFEIDTKGDRVL